MANPANVIQTTSFGKFSKARTVSTSSSWDYEVNSSNYSYIVQNAVAHNYSSSVQTFTCMLGDGQSATYYLLNGVTIPAKSSLIVVSKENPIYLYYSSTGNELRRFGGFASANSSVNFITSVEYYNG